jgi:hypothetical protein
MLLHRGPTDLVGVMHPVLHGFRLGGLGGWINCAFSGWPDEPAFALVPKIQVKQANGWQNPDGGEGASHVPILYAGSRCISRDQHPPNEMTL